MRSKATLNPEEVADRVGVTARTVRRRCALIGASIGARKTAPGPRGDWRIPADAIDHFKDVRRGRPPKKQPAREESRP